MLIDTHCHLDFPDFAADPAAVVARAKAAGVQQMITICTRISRLAPLQALAAQFPEVFYSVGVHPHHAAEPDEACDAAHLVALAAPSKVVAIGEAGLDYHYNYSPVEQQQETFRAHIRACLETGLPLVVHTREAEDDTMRILREEAAGAPLKGVLHCFSSSAKLAEEALEFGFYLSFSGIVTFKKSEDLRAVVRTTPLDRILVETDAPYLAPIPRRGGTNEPSFVVHTAEVVAGLKDLSVADFAVRATANSYALFDRMTRVS